MPEVISFEQALRETEDQDRNLLLGNGFSVSWKQAIFSYKSLRESAVNIADTTKRVFDKFTLNYDMLLYWVQMKDKFRADGRPKLKKQTDGFAYNGEEFLNWDGGRFNVNPKSFTNFFKLNLLTFLSQKSKPMSFASAYRWSLFLLPSLFATYFSL